MSEHNQHDREAPCPVCHDQGEEIATLRASLAKAQERVDGLVEMLNAWESKLFQSNAEAVVVMRALILRHVPRPSTQATPKCPCEDPKSRSVERTACRASRVHVEPQATTGKECCPIPCYESTVGRPCQHEPHWAGVPMTDKKQEPLPCPFCGDYPEEVGPFLECPNEGCANSNHDFTLEEWNRRAPSKSEDEVRTAAWREVQRWLVEIFELDAARKLDMKIMEQERDTMRAKALRAGKREEEEG